MKTPSPGAPGRGGLNKPVTPRQAALLIALVTCAAYLNSFGGVFVFDDIHEIVANPHLESLLPPWEAMFRGNKAPSRPLPYLTFAIDRAIWGVEPFGYHVTNLVVHLVASLALFDFTRQTLLSARLRDRWGGHAVTLALVIAGLWAVHPLQTQAVTYVYQRIEAMLGMFGFLSLAAFARAMSGNHARPWLAASFAACAAAMACKESAVVLPPLLLAYDWLFSSATPSGTWPDSVGRHARFHLGCFLTWTVLAAVMASQSGRYPEFTGTRRSPFSYAMTQPAVILHYLRLAILPVGQCFEYSGWPLVREFAFEHVPAYGVIAAMVGLTVYGLVRRRPWAWLGVLFFGGLAPTSSVLPVDAVANEHRMYLPMAAVTAVIVLGACECGRWFGSRFGPRLSIAPVGLARVGMLAAGIAAVVLVGLTHARNRLYRSPTTLWNDVLAQDPRNFRALTHFAKMNDDRGDAQAAFELADRVLDLAPGYDVYGKLAFGRVVLGDDAGAEQRFRLAIDRQRAMLTPDDPTTLRTTGDLAILLRLRGKIDEAASLCHASLPDMLRVLGEDHEVTLAARQIVAESQSLGGDHAAAETAARDVARRARNAKGPTSEPAINATVTLFRVLDAGGKIADAERIVRRAIDELPATGTRHREARLMLQELFADALEKQGRFDEAVALRHRVADEHERLHGRESLQTAAALTKHALAVAARATARGDHRQAAAIYSQIEAHHRAALGPDHADTRSLAEQRSAAEDRARRADDKPATIER